MISEYGNYQMLIEKKALVRPDIMVVTIDANCAKHTRKRKEVLDETHQPYRGMVVVGCPDPHVERWYLADIPSFQRVVGISPHFQKRKCQRDYYKRVLASAVRDGGHPLTLGGIEFAEELVEVMDLYAAGKADTSLGTFIDDLRKGLRRMGETRNSCG